jgi:small GTP-binding protein
MIQKKVCLLGTSGVGKTSLVAQFVHSMFSDKYLTTVGVKIDKKSMAVDGTEVTLVIWDLAGDDDFQRLQISYLRGTSGYLLVADGTRAQPGARIAKTCRGDIRVGAFHPRTEQD